MRFSLSKLFGWSKPPIPVGVPTESTGEAMRRYRALDQLRYVMPTTELDSLKFARLCAESVTDPNLQPLMAIFDELLDNDAHLTNLMRKFRLSVTNKDFAVLTASGDVDEAATELLRGQWFRTYLTLVIDSLSYGFSLVGFDFSDGISCFNFPRGFVVPQLRALRVDAYSGELAPIGDMEGKDFILVQDASPTSRLGLLNTAAPLAIYKKHSLSSWDRFEMLFGAPMRIAKTDSRNPSELNLIESWLEDMGQAAYGIFPSDTELELLATSSTDAYNVFMQKANFVNSELSKLYLSQTMTTDDGSSRSQAEVHADGEAQVLKDNAAFAVDFVENQLFELLRNNGYRIPDGATFTFLDEAMSAAERIELIDSKLLAGGVKLSKQYLEETYGVEVADDLPSVTMAMQPDKKKVVALFSKVHRYMYGDADLPITSETMEDAPDNADIIARIIAAIGQGEEPNDQDIIDLANSYFDSFMESLDLAGTTDEVTELLTDNLREFADAKATTEVTALMELAGLDDFVDQANALHSMFNVTWQASEFDTTFNAGVNADKWNDAIRTQDSLPKGKYTTQNDALVRKDHAELDDMVFPLDSPIWNTYWPPNGYNCRCTVRKVRSSVPNTFGMALPVLPELFRNNPAKNGTVFKYDHPYFENRP